MCEDTRLPFDLPSVAHKKVSAGFDGGQLSSDAGVLALRSVEKKLGLAVRLASSIRDRRKAERIEHPLRRRPRRCMRVTHEQAISGLLLRERRADQIADQANGSAVEAVFNFQTRDKL